MTLLAQISQSETSTTVQLNWPDSPLGWTTLLGGFALAAAYVVWMYVRDTERHSTSVTIWLTTLRLAVFALLFVIALNPQERTQKEAFRPSQVAILVDTSSSMQQPENDPRSAGDEEIATRAEAARRLLLDQNLVERLRRDHAVTIYTFDETLHDPLVRLAPGDEPEPPEPAEDETRPSGTPKEDLQTLLAENLQPRGMSTRLGDALDELISEVKGTTLSGVVVLTDGVSNVGRDLVPANTRARENRVRLFAIGTGSTEPPVNLQIARLIAPTDVQLGDGFELVALLSGRGLAGEAVKVELLRQTPNDPEPELVESQQVVLGDDSDPVEVTFSQAPEAEGNVEYSMRAELVGGKLETRTDDNVVAKSINIFDRPTQMLIMAGGPMRDYRFVRDALNRHPSFEVDVWLQTGQVGISQDAREVIFDFPQSREELFKYDVIMAFDLDWSELSDADQSVLEEWVSNEGGGLLLVAGDINTPRLAAAEDDFQAIHRLYPVILDQVRIQFQDRSQSMQPWPIGLTPEGKAAEFLQLVEDGSGRRIWDEFPGVYGCYPTAGRKGGTTVYAHYTDPLAQGSNGPPILLASQRYGQGTSMYLGSPEMWRLRAIDVEMYERLWTKMVRRAGEGRTKRGMQRGMFILDGREYDLGQTVTVRVRVLNGDFQPLDQPTFTIDVRQPDGRPLVPGLTLRQDRNRPSEYVGDLRASQPGRYRMSLDVPDSAETVSTDFLVEFPRLEAASMQQDVRALRELTAETGGRYLTTAEAADVLPELLPLSGQSFMIDQRLSELWDRGWLLGLLIGLLGAEWLTRKLLKLA